MGFTLEQKNIQYAAYSVTFHLSTGRSATQALSVFVVAFAYTIFISFLSLP